jgi:hypothetical protein
MGRLVDRIGATPVRTLAPARLKLLLLLVPPLVPKRAMTILRLAYIVLLGGLFG